MKQPGAEEALQRYRALLLRYHATLDLLSERGLAEVDRWLAEAGAYADVIARVAPEARVVLDVGSGAGLPGIVLAIRFPDRTVVLTERRRKRATFLALVVGQLGLNNAVVEAGDVRNLRGVRADVVVAQAVAELPTVVAMTRHLMGPDAVVVSRKGPDWLREVAAVAATVAAQGDTTVTVVAEEPLEHRGTLVALRLAGG